MNTPSPFKFLAPYDKEDKELFFGREEEIRQLHRMTFESDLLLVYGQSGTGKTSLVQCGLASCFDDSDWLDIYIRRRQDINRSFEETLRQKALRPVKEEAGLPEMVQAIFKDYLRPVFLIFDQFEELFILGAAEEQVLFVRNLQELMAAGLNCKAIIILREEYLAHLYQFEEYLPTLFDKRLRVELMSPANIRKVIRETCRQAGIGLEPEKETVAAVMDNIHDSKSGTQLAYLQVYLDKLWQQASGPKGLIGKFKRQ
ncbi:MAG: ATP-binding protein [Phaeodactylibacter sp.]|nr:ATP-binding protein [Phaeodactylibacter sp.]